MARRPIQTLSRLLAEAEAEFDDPIGGPSAQDAHSEATVSSVESPRGDATHSDWYDELELYGLSRLCASFSENGRVHVSLLAGALVMCPVAERLLERAAASGDTLTTEQALLALRPCGAYASAESKVRALFDAYDLDGDGLVGAADAFSMLKLFQSDEIPDDTLEALANELAGERGLDFGAFARRFAAEDIIMGMQLGVIPMASPAF